MSEMVPYRQKRQKSGGRQKGTPNRITLDIRRALRDLADANAGRVQEWLDRVAEADPAEAMRLWLALLRFVTPTLQAAAIADITPKSSREVVSQMTDAELMTIIRQGQPRLGVTRAHSPAVPPTIIDSRVDEIDDLLR